jgi:hypothetical protein
MIFNKSIFAVAVMALANVVAAGTTTPQTPACVLKIIGYVHRRNGRNVNGLARNS